jgi:hypothetical protein
MGLRSSPAQMMPLFASGTYNQSFDQHSSFIRSIALSSDALQIFSTSKLHKVVYTWSPTDACGKLISKTKTTSRRTSTVLDPFVLTLDGWIVDISLNRPVSKLPPNISILAVTASAASDRSFIIATNHRAVIILHFRENAPVDADTLRYYFISGIINRTLEQKLITCIFGDPRKSYSIVAVGKITAVLELENDAERNGRLCCLYVCLPCMYKLWGMQSVNYLMNYT